MSECVCVSVCVCVSTRVLHPCHSADHYQGLSCTFAGTLYCTHVTKQLVTRCLGVSASRVVSASFSVCGASAGLLTHGQLVARLRFPVWGPLQIGVDYHDTLSVAVGKDVVEVTALDAHHCPGSAMFLFRYPVGDAGGAAGDKKTFHTMLYTGDVRWVDPHPDTVRFLQAYSPVDCLFLDTTFMAPEFLTLPTQV